MKRVKPVRNAAVIVRVFPEERDILRFNAGLHGMSMSDYIRQTCLGVRLRKTPEEKRRLRELARIGANLNQLARWANETFSGWLVFTRSLQNRIICSIVNEFSKR